MEWQLLLTSGVAMGSIYALVALGFVLVYRALGIINFAQGDLAMVAAYLAVTASSQPLPLWLAYVIALVAAMGVNTVVQQLIYYPLRNQSVIVTIIGTIGLSVALQQTAQLIWGSFPAVLRELVPSRPVALGSVSWLPQHLFIIAVTGALCLGLYFFFRSTRLGVVVQAAAQDRVAARLMGIRIQRVAWTTFALNGLLTAVAGLLIGPIFFVTTDMGTSVLVKAFAAAIIGGFGSVLGAVVGGLLVGVAETFVTAYVSSHYKDAIAFLMIILVLVLLPRGLFGEPVGERL